MKRIKRIKEMYYPDEEEVEKIKASNIPLNLIAVHLGCSYTHLYRRLKRYRGAYFTREDVMKIQKITGITFNIH